MVPCMIAIVLPLKFCQLLVLKKRPQAAQPKGQQQDQAEAEGGRRGRSDILGNIEYFVVAVVAQEPAQPHKSSQGYDEEREGARTS